VVLEGRLEGEMDIRGMVSIGPDGTTVGRISAQEVVLKGSVEGEVEASNRLVITASGKLSGGMDAPRLVIEEGGRLQGRCRMSAGAREGVADLEEKPPLLPSFQEALESR
jgi:cytoskeletal protein CcmA (bactofilin family)